MSAQANIVLADGQGTPVNHTFEPNGAFSNETGVIKSAWVDRTGHSLEIGRTILREDHRPGNGVARERQRFVLEVPTVETVEGVQKRTRLHAVDIEVRFDPGATQLERDNVAAYAKNFLAHAYTQDKIKSGARTW